MSCLLMLNGRIGKIEKSLTRTGTTTVKVAIASSNDGKDKDGNYKTEWTDVTAFGKKAEYIYNYSHKGDIVSVIAKKQTDKVIDANGNNKYYTNYLVGEAFYCYQILQHKNNNNIEEKKVEDNIGQNIDNIGDITSELGMEQKEKQKEPIVPKVTFDLPSLVEEEIPY